MKFRKIGTKMIVIILPIMIIAQGILTIISSFSSSQLINKQVSERMSVELDYNTTKMSEYLEGVKTLADALAISVGNTYKKTSLTEYETMLTELIKSNDIVLGSGLWFEPYVYDEKEQYVGPYVYKNGDNIEITYDYSNAEYDYFSQEYYLNAMNLDSAKITDPYYDATSNTIMATCSSPIISGGKKIGCVTVDMELSAIEGIVNNVIVGTDGRAMLTTADGTYLAGTAEEKISNGVKINQDEDKNIAAAGEIVISNASGITKYEQSNTKYNLYYTTLADQGWKFMIYIPEYELVRPILLLMNQLIGVCIIAVVVAAIIIIRQIGGIAKSIAMVQQFARELATGDFTIEYLKVNGEDELALMSQSLNEMYGSNKSVIENISQKAQQISQSSIELNDSANNLRKEFDSIAHYMSNVNEAMMNSSAATEQLSASVEQVDRSVDVLADETKKSLNMALEIKKRANDVEKTSVDSFDTANKLKDNYEKKLAESIEQAKVVENIGEMARIISDIAEQITLLSLNASIEAARAGDQGRGFAVVATEIGKLAGETAEAVSTIQETITEVHVAFENLASNANGLLGFVSETVTPDYRSFVDVANQYGKDAESINHFSDTISRMSDDIRQIMSEITNAIQNIAESTQNTADVSTSILESVDHVAGVVGSVSDMSTEQSEISNNLNDVVQKFKLYG